MTNSTKITHVPIPIGSLPVDDFMLLDGAYQVSQAQVTDAVEEPPVYALRFLQLKGSEALLKKTYTRLHSRVS